MMDDPEKIYIESDDDELSEDPTLKQLLRVLVFSL